MEKRLQKETLCIHAGRENMDAGDGVNTPVYPSTSYPYRNRELVYPRYYNTVNQRVIAEKIAALEGGEAGIVFGSGMAAISTALFSLLKRGDHAVFVGGLYGGTVHLLLTEFTKQGIGYSIAEGSSTSGLEAVVEKNTKVLFFETPTNPLLSIFDIKSVAKLSCKYSLTSIIDNTFASPINQNPLQYGIDIVIHSGTKYLGGHSDLCFGAVVSDKETIEKIRECAVNFGAVLNAFDCHLIERSLKTLAVRVQRQNDNALAVAGHLEKSEKIRKVYYPGLESHPGYKTAKKQMKGFGGMLSFELKDTEKTDMFLDALRLITPAVSLGGVESIICAPVATSHRKVPAQAREKQGITEGLLRFSTGLEHVSDLIRDIDEGLGKI